MPAKIKIVGMYVKVQDEPGVVVNTTSKAAGKWETDLSPFHLGPCKLYDKHVARNMENAWQFSKVYAMHTKAGEPTQKYWDWAREGWANPKPVRYPIRRGAKPEYSLWQGEKLGYIEARKKIYAPLYAEAVQMTEGWKKLKEIYEKEDAITLRDYDGYHYTSLGMSLTEVLNNPRKKMGHAFVLAMLLMEDEALDQISLR